MWRMLCVVGCPDGPRCPNAASSAAIVRRLRRTPSWVTSARRLATATTASGTGLRCFASTRGGSLGVTTMLELGDKPGLLELTHGAQDLAHYLRGR